MMNFATFSFFILAIICGLSNAAQMKKELKAAGSKVCSTETFAKLNTCCSFPKLLTYESFSICLDNIEDIAKKSAQLKRPSKAKSAGFISNFFRSSSAAKKTRRGQLPGGPSCIMECLLRNQALLTTSGEVDAMATKKLFTSQADPVWLPIVEEAVNKCDSEIKKVDPKSLVSIQAGSETQCKPNSAMFISCVRRYLALGCPPRNVTKPVTEFCTRKIENLKACDPFSVTPVTVSSGKE